MNTNREEKLEKKLKHLQEEIKAIRKELHTCKQKNLDMEKSRSSYKEQLKQQETANDELRAELKKKR